MVELEFAFIGIDYNHIVSRHVKWAADKREVLT